MTSGTRKWGSKLGLESGVTIQNTVFPISYIRNIIHKLIEKIGPCISKFDNIPKLKQMTIRIQIRKKCV